MSNNQLPGEIQEQIKKEAEQYGNRPFYNDGSPLYSVPQYSGKLGYIIGATEWAIWKQRYDELKAQAGTKQFELAFAPCAEDDPRSVGSYTSSDGQSLCFVRELHVPEAHSGTLLIKTEAIAIIEYLRENYKRRKDHWTDNFNIANLTDEGVYELFKQKQSFTATDVNGDEVSGATDWKAKYDELLYLSAKEFTEKWRNEGLRNAIMVSLQQEHAALKDRSINYWRYWSKLFMPVFRQMNGNIFPGLLLRRISQVVLSRTWLPKVKPLHGKRRKNTPN
jgi:hypothetical protein